MKWNGYIIEINKMVNGLERGIETFHSVAQNRRGEKESEEIIKQEILNKYSFLIHMKLNFGFNYQAMLRRPKL